MGHHPPNFDYFPALPEQAAPIFRYWHRKNIIGVRFYYMLSNEAVDCKQIFHPVRQITVLPPRRRTGFCRLNHT